MPIKFPCPGCKLVLSVKDELAGSKGTCPRCKTRVVVPAAGAAAPASAKPPAALTDWLDEQQAREAPAKSPAGRPPAPKPAATGKATADRKAASPPPAGVRPPRQESADSTAPPAETTPPEPPVDVEAEAAALFAEGENAGPAAAPATVDFTCPYCDTELHLPAELAGKKSPCPNPECRRILKVPELTKTDPKDWRKANVLGPTGAKPTTGPAPEGAWSSTERTYASGQALREAGVITKRAKPRTLAQKLFRPVLAATAVLVLGGGGWWWYSAWAAGRETRALQEALDYAHSDAGRQQVGVIGQAVLLKEAGDYFLRTGQPAVEESFLHKGRQGCGVLARNHYGQALALLTQIPADSERDAALAELAAAEVGLGGDPLSDDVRAELRIPWDEVQNRVRATLSAMGPGGRLDALRAVARRFIAGGRADRVLPLTGQVYSSPEADKAEALAAVGLELLGVGDADRAGKAADQALAPYAGKKPPPVRPAVIALAMALKKPVPKAGKGPDERADHFIGETEGLARLGQWDDARKKAQTATFGPNPQLRALVGVAAAAVDAKAPHAGSDVEAALAFVKGQVRNWAPLAWELRRLGDLGQRAGLSEERLRALAEANPDAALRGRGQLAAFTMQMTGTKEAVEDGAAEQAVGRSASQLLAVEALARHNTRRDPDWAKGVAAWEQPRRPFGAMGIARGLQDRAKGE